MIDDQDPRHADGEIVVCPDGPLLVRGEVTLVASDGAVLPRRRRTTALCRCGSSAIKPFCDGSHKVVGFTTGGDAART